MHSPSRNAVLILIGASLVLHITEEYVTYPAFFRSSSRLLHWLPTPVLLQNPQQLHLALLMAAVLPLAVVAWAVLRPGKALLVAVLFLESVLLVNAFWHMLAAVVNRGYVPGVITAVLINLPFGIYVLRRAIKERWIGQRTAWQMIAAAAVLHIAAVGSVLG
ncbi:MAG TPA: HXXEE domain-containing protein [Terriglobales bacterium]|jgi:hypothetical protein